MEEFDRSAFVSACHSAFALASDSAVARAWDNESACKGMTVGGLTHHLLAQIDHVVTALEGRPPDGVPIPLLDHYTRAAWVTADHDDDANVSIRESADESAKDGQASVLAHAAKGLAHLPAALAATREPDVVPIPWQGWSLTTDDFLVTRSMELMVHSDDLAASLELPLPEFPEPVAERVVQLLSGVAMRRHGQSAVIRGLSRPQRSPLSISAF